MLNAWNQRILAVYNAVYEESRFTEVLADFSKTYQLRTCAILHCNQQGRVLEDIASHGYDIALRRRLAPALYARLSFLVDEPLFKVSNRIWFDREFTGELTCQESDYFRYWMAPQGVKRLAFGMIDNSLADGNFTLLELTADARDLFDEERIDSACGYLLPHLRQAMELRRQFALSQAAQEPAIPSNMVAMPPAMRLRSLYQLTRNETHVALHLAGGLDPQRIAAEMGISCHTVRSHLGKIRAKTDTHNQGELVRLLLAGPAALTQTGAEAFSQAS